MFDHCPWVLLRLPGVFPFYSSCKPPTLCYIVEAPGNVPTAKDPMGFISSKNKSAISAGSGGGSPDHIQRLITDELATIDFPGAVYVVRYARRP